MDFEEIKCQLSEGMEGKNWYNGPDEPIKWLIAEVERLQKAVVDHTIRCERIISESQGEVERLRAELADAQKRIELLESTRPSFDELKEE